MSPIVDTDGDGAGGPMQEASARRDEACLTFWRGLDELENGAVQLSHLTAEPHVNVTHGIAWPRRNFLKTMGASLALAGTAGCSRTPLEKIVPYRDGPAQSTYGKPVFYASAISRDGYGCGVLVETNMGRPTKIEGNALHPASLGATDAITQAAVLELWDPDRSKQVRRGRSIDTWDRFVGELVARLEKSHDGHGVFLLTESITSPTLFAQINTLLSRFPGAKWHQYQPLNRDNVYAGSRIAYDVAMEPYYRFEQARIVVSLDADIMTTSAGSVRYAHDIMKARQLDNPLGMARLYVAEGTPTLTGAIADHKRATRTCDIAALAIALAARLGAIESLDAPAARPATSDPWLDAVVAELQQHRGTSIIVAGDRQPASVHALVFAMNEHLGNIGSAVILRAPIAFETSSQESSMVALRDAIVAGNVETLVMLGGNPAYYAPADVKFADALSKVPWKAHLSLFDDETSVLCTWHVPASHVLEAWGDIRAYDGTTTVQQPCIAPLYDGQSAHQVLSVMIDGSAHDDYEIVRSFWQTQQAGDFEAFWREALYRGSIDAAPSSNQRTLRPDAIRAAALQQRGEYGADDAIELVWTQDPTLGDGRHANNAWLQELPKPLTTLTWGNAALLAPALAQRLGVANEDVIELGANGQSVLAPVWIMPGHVDRSITLYLGHGRTRAGNVGNGVGVGAYVLRASRRPWFVAAPAVTKTNARYPLAAAQAHSRMEGRDLVRIVSRADAERCATAPCPTGHAGDLKRSMYAEFPYDAYKWGMSIDLSSCFGCAACTIACQAENNIAVVGKEEVRNGRELHWIRVDRYYGGSRDRPQTLFQPVPCMQCEHAPCEEVCPVEASVHDAEGLNVQVYNRCVGTRFCSNNCPYKVRRFNFLDYSRKQASLDAQRNPEVTVRMRGVMEKCSYCIQRVANARSNADRSNRRIADGEVVTACQAVCPTQAIVFGDLNDPDSAVSKRKSSPLDYALLAELNTRPRTTYLPRISNAAPGVDVT